MLETLKRLWGFVRGFAQTSISSGTAEYPTPQDVFRALYSATKDREGCFATFQVDGPRPWVQIAPDSGGTVLNFWYPYGEDVRSVLTRTGLTLPEGVGIEYCKLGKAATLKVDRCDEATVGTLVDNLFRRLYNCDADYVVRGWVD